MNKVRATRVIVLFLVVVAVSQVIEKRNDLQCYVVQQADLHRWFYDEGLATVDQIRESVRNSLIDDFHGQNWRLSLDRIYHAILMGGDRASQVVARLQSPSETISDTHCFGYVSWSIWDDGNVAGDEDHHDLYAETIDDVAAVLESIPAEELRHFTVSASVIASVSNWSGTVSTYTSRVRHSGDVSARAWLRGEFIPAPYADWYADWLSQQEEQEPADGE